MTLALPHGDCEAHMKSGVEAFCLTSSQRETHRLPCDQDSPLTIIQHRFGWTQPGGDEKIKIKRNRRNFSSWERSEFALFFPFSGCNFCRLLWENLFPSFFGWKHKLINKQKDGACDWANTWQEPRRVISLIRKLVWLIRPEVRALTAENSSSRAILRLAGRDFGPVS